MRNQEVIALFERAYSSYHKIDHPDPVSRVHQYSNPEDQEVVAFFSAILAYGNVRMILKSIDRVLAPLGPHPSQILRERKFGNAWNGFAHRFTRGEDIEIVANWLASILEEGPLEKAFITSSRDNVKTLLENFAMKIWHLPLPPHLSSVAESRKRNLKYLIARPSLGSACKRMNMFLRWMVRPADGVDLGIWRSYSPSQLMLPVDTHILKTLQQLRWTQAKTASWAVVEQATEKLKKLLPEDPIRYDFALCHLSMDGQRLHDYRNDHHA